jgi:hypothetical protein
MYLMIENSLLIIVRVLNDNPNDTRPSFLMIIVMIISKVSNDNANDNSQSFLMIIQGF